MLLFGCVLYASYKAVSAVSCQPAVYIVIYQQTLGTDWGSPGIRTIRVGY